MRRLQLSFAVDGEPLGFSASIAPGDTADGVARLVLALMNAVYGVRPRQLDLIGGAWR